MFFTIGVHHHGFSIFIRPKFMKFNKNRHHCIALAAVYQILQCDASRILRFDHVKNFIFHIIKINWFSAMRQNLILNTLKSDNHFMKQHQSLMQSNQPLTLKK